MRKALGVAALLAVLGMPAAATAQDHYPSPAGTWMVKVLFAGWFELAFLQQNLQDGRTLILLPTGPDHPNVGDSRVGCMGEWRARRGGGPREYDLLQRCLYNQAWAGIYADIRGVMRLNQKGDRWEADFTYTDFSADGVELFSGPGVMVAERVALDRRP